MLCLLLSTIWYVSACGRHRLSVCAQPSADTLRIQSQSSQKPSQSPTEQPNNVPFNNLNNGIRVTRQQTENIRIHTSVEWKTEQFCCGREMCCVKSVPMLFSTASLAHPNTEYRIQTSQKKRRDKIFRSHKANIYRVLLFFSLFSIFFFFCKKNSWKNQSRRETRHEFRSVRMKKAHWYVPG